MMVLPLFVINATLNLLDQIFSLFSINKFDLM